MSESTARVTSRGRVTIPATVRRHLGVDAADQVSFHLNDDGTVTLRRVPTVLDLAGSLPALAPGASVDFEAEIAEAMEERADQLVARLRRG